MKAEFVHLILSLTVGGVLYYFYKKRSVFLWAIVGGLLVDVDHLIDYFIWKRPFGFNLSEFLAGDQFHGSGKLYIFFHSFEWVILMWGVLVCVRLGWLKIRNGLKIALLALSFSLFFHLCFDIVHNSTGFGTYFIVNRAAHNFNLSNFCFGG